MSWSPASAAYSMTGKSYMDTNGGGDGASSQATNSEPIPENIRALVNKLLVKNSQQQRQAVIIVAAFGVAASLLVMFSIQRDARKAQVNDFYGPKKRFGVKRLHPAEVFPFLTALAIVIQSGLFIAVQALTLSEFWTTRCRLVAQVVWPAVWLVPVVVLIFSIEVTLRSIRKKRFQPRGKWATPACLFLVVLLMVALWLTAFFMPGRDTCPANLIWSTVHYARLGIIFGPGIIVTHFVSATILASQLWRTVKMDRDERIAASRAVYSLGVNVVVIAIALPFWIERLMGNFPYQSSKAADIGLVLPGLVHGGLYVFLRANAERLAIRPHATPWSTNKNIRIFGPNDLNMGMFISTPLLASNPQNTGDWNEWSNDNEKLFPKPKPIGNSTDPRPNSPNKPTSPLSRVVSPTTNTPNVTVPVLDPTQLSPATAAPPKYTSPPMSTSQLAPPNPRYSKRQRAHSKSSYSIFPTAASARITSWLSSRSATSQDDRAGRASSVYTSAVGLPPSSELEPPQPLFARPPGHTRNDSTMTSATVEIGMRLSSMADAQPFGSPRASGDVVASDKLSPIVATAPAPNIPSGPASQEGQRLLNGSAFSFPRPPIPQVAPPSYPPRTSSRTPKWPGRDSFGFSERQRIRRARMMKSLPPTPPPAGPLPARSDSDARQGPWIPASPPPALTLGKSRYGSEERDSEAQQERERLGMGGTVGSARRPWEEPRSAGSDVSAPSYHSPGYSPPPIGRSGKSLKNLSPWPLPREGVKVGEWI